MKRLAAIVRTWLSTTQERAFIIALAGLVGTGGILRLLTLSTGTLYRDDAWVVLGSRLPVSTAWRMTGTAPGFAMIERAWFQWVGPTTWAAQLPTLFVSLVGMLALAALLRWWGASRLATLFGVALLAFSRIDINYATHLKPYAHDVLASIVLLAAAQWWRRGGSAWWFSALAALCLVTSFTIFPLAVGVSLVIFFQAIRTDRLSSLTLPALAGIVPVGLVAYLIRNGISPRLDRSWRASYVDFHALHTMVASTWDMTSSLLWGIGNTTPGIAVPLFGRAFQLLMIGLALVALRRRALVALPLSAIVAAYVAAALHLAPLGTGRTDAYLHPALIMMFVFGAEEVITWLKPRHLNVARAVVVSITLAMALTGVDRLAHRSPYPGGDLRPVALQARTVLSRGGAVLVEGTARWPWALYETHDLAIHFSTQYNTGFAPISRDPHVVLMPGTSIEGGYDPKGAIAMLRHAPRVLYIQSDDWPGMSSAVIQAALNACYDLAPTQPKKVAGYTMQLWTYSCQDLALKTRR